MKEAYLKRLNSVESQHPRMSKTMKSQRVSGCQELEVWEWEGVNGQGTMRISVKILCYDTVMMDAYSYTFVQTYRMNDIKTEFESKVNYKCRGTVMCQCKFTSCTKGAIPL